MAAVASPPAAHSAVELSRLIKGARRDMRKDKGLNGDLDRIPILTWVMFLKFLDDTEKVREDEAVLRKEKYEPLCEAPYRWRDWATGKNAPTGDALINFISQDEAMRPDGQRGPGLFAYLRGLQGTGTSDRREVISTVFTGIANRMTNGYLLRDVIEKVDKMHFAVSGEVHTLSHLYESLLREMRDAAKDSGEFYTPRPVVQFMVDRTAPQIGETVLDPASGTGGFLVEAYRYMEALVKAVRDREVLQGSIFGGEPKSLPYLMAQMNLLLHGMDSPQIDPGNSLRFKLSDIGEKDRVDVILTNPPFGGEEERGILGNFPANKQTAETALLFLQLIMRKLRRKEIPGRRPGRAAVVVPDGILAGDGVAARIKKDLLEGFNVHTIIRLPAGVFAPYTDIPTNVMFFDYGGPTTDIWFYELPLPEEYKKYSKTKPLRYEEFDPVRDWWEDRQVTEQAWKVTKAEVEEDDYNLDIRNPVRLPEDTSVPMVDRTSRASAAATDLAKDAAALLGLEDWKTLAALDPKARKTVVMGDILEESGVAEDLLPDQSYRLLGVSLLGKGPFLRETKLGSEISADRAFKVAGGSFIYSRLFAWRGAFGVVPPQLDGTYVSNEFPTYKIDETDVLIDYLRLYFMRPTVWHEVERKCRGTTKGSRNRFHPDRLKEMTITVPDKSLQQQIVDMGKRSHQIALEARLLQAELEEMPRNLLAHLYDGEL
jgi:type I restriction enzyme M protein